VFAGDTYNPRCHITFCMFAIGMVEGSEATTYTHLLIASVSEGQLKGRNK
jgi:hypothetical protein